MQLPREFMEISLQQATSWLLGAQWTAGKFKGYVPKVAFPFYRFSPYPEITGYSISLLMELYEITNRDIFLRRAQLAVEALRNAQLTNGAYNSVASPSEQKIVFFDHSIILNGLIDYYEITKESQMFGSIEKAGSFLLANQKRDGSLHESLYFHGSHFVSAKAALPLVKLYKITNEKKYLDSAYRLANHVISSFNKSGGGFSLDLDVPHYNRTHFLCYAVEGLTALNEYYPEFSDYIVNACRYLAELQDSRGFIPYGFSPNGALSINSPDLAATAQTARLMLYAQNNISPEEGKYQRIVEKCVSFLLEKQHKFRHSFLDGGVPYGYKLFMDRVTVCSWATLFLANALLMVLFPDFRRISF